jgi:hypothetical protein
MTKDKTNVKQKKVGRPVTIGGDEFVGLRLPSDMLGVIDAYGAANGLKRSEAIRHLIEFGLANTATAKAKRAKVNRDARRKRRVVTAKKGGAE